MDISNIIPHIEALIFASEKPLTPAEITELANNAFGFMEDKITPEQVEAAIGGIVEKYSAEFYPFEMRQSGGGWQFLTKKDYHKTVAQLNGEKFLKRLSSASLETLAIIAYKQPITKGEIEAIRGVNSDYSIQKLLEKELILITGRNEELPGKPLLYVTSKNFMDYFGLNSPEDLPRIREVLAEQAVEPTSLHPAEPEENNEPVPDGELSLVVRGNGELIEEPAIVVDEETDAVDPEDVVNTDADSHPETDEPLPKEEVLDEESADEESFEEEGGDEENVVEEGPDEEGPDEKANDDIEESRKEN